MREGSQRSWWRGLEWLAAALGALGVLTPVHAQVVPPGALEQLDTLVGDRVETMFVLGTQSGASGGTYLSDINDTAVDVFKITGRGDVGSPKPIGDSGVGWNLVFEGGIGHATYTNRFNTNQLAGNESEVATFAVSLGAGVRFTFLERVSLAPTLGVIYGHTENEFTARNDVGRAVLARADGTLVNWDADIFTIVPGLEGRYRQPIGPVTIELTSAYKYFQGWPIRRSTQALSFESESHWWRNELDVDYRLPLYAFGRQFRTGVYFARSELWDGLENAFRSDYLYDVGGRFVIDLLGALWKVEWIGIGGGYFWNNVFSGWTVGVDIRMKF
jgi:hypothetical protein